MFEGKVRSLHAVCFGRLQVEKSGAVSAKSAPVGTSQTTPFPPIDSLLREIDEEPNGSTS